MKKNLLFLLCFLWSGVAFCQQRPQLTQYMQNNFLVNPAVAGIEDYGDVRTGFRRQWMGIDETPTTFYASVHAALNKHNRNTTSLKGQQRANVVKTNANRNNRFYRKGHHGVGALAQTDKAGNLRASTLNLSYAFHLPVSQEATLAAGVSTGVTQLGFDRNWVVAHEDDTKLTSDLNNQWRPDMGLGLWLYSQDYFVGLSGVQLLGGLGDKNESGEDSPGTNLDFVLQPHFYLTGGYKWQLLPDLILAPSVMVKYSASRQAALDLNLKALQSQRFWLGMSYRHRDALAAMVGVYLSPHLDVSYSYDFAISELRRVNAMSHEVVLGFRFSNPGKILCPKYLW